MDSSMTSLYDVSRCVVNLGFTYDKDNKVKCTECGVDNIEIRDDMIFQHSQMCDFFRNEYMSERENRLKTFEKSKIVGRGALIVVEGLDKTGKTTHCSKLVSKLIDEGNKVRLISFPGTS